MAVDNRYSDMYMQRAEPGPEHIRQHPGMYIGSTDSRGLHFLLFGLIDLAITESSAGYGQTIQVILHDDGSVSVIDDGRGLDPSREPGIEAIFIHGAGSTGSGHWFDRFAYMIAAALSEWLQIETHCDGQTYRWELRQGVPTGPVRSCGPTEDSGLMIRFQPDPTIFSDTQFNRETIRERLRELAFLHPKARIVLQDEEAATEDWAFPDGIRAFVRWLNEGRETLHSEILVVDGNDHGVRYEVGLQWCQDHEPIERLYVNDELAPLGGRPITGLRAAVTRTVNKYIRKHAPGSPTVKEAHTRGCLTAIITLWLAAPRFEGAIKGRLINEEARTVIETGVGRFLREYFASNLEVADRIARAAIQEAEAEAASKAARRVLRERQAREDAE